MASIIQKDVDEFTFNILKFAPTAVIRNIFTTFYWWIYPTIAYYLKNPIPITTVLIGHIKRENILFSWV